ncbi:MAG: peptidoglycan-binding domain-containing protein [Bacillota bacterium]
MAIGYGSRGADVKKLQQQLNAYGAGLKVDGIWGPKTQAAYQKYGSKLSSSKTTSTAIKKPTTAGYLAKAEANKPVYTQSNALKMASQQLAAYQKNKPGAYQSQYGDQIQALLDQIMNRKDFSYDFSADPLYQQYKDQYTKQGQMAMMDTMGQAAALSGGYGNSYAQTAGQQMYQQNLQNLNAIIPELQQAAYSKYANEGNEMQTNLSNLQGLDASDYQKYQGDVADYYNQLQYLAGRVDTMSDQEYNDFLTKLQAWQADRDYWFNKQQTEQEQKNWQTQWDYQVAQNAAKNSGGGGSGSSKRYSGSGGGKKSTKTTKKASSIDELDKQYQEEMRKKVLKTYTTPPDMWTYKPF